MNKYLLLRNNKQSGPYTVPEIIEIGLKPYDLVWMEGKSAAWRYPSEIEELKAYAPAVEEQPFDRFYKKPEIVQGPNLDAKASNTATGAAVEHEKYQPKIEDNSKQNRKVYINFPASTGKPVKQPPVVEKNTSNDSTHAEQPAKEYAEVRDVTTPVMRTKAPVFPERKSPLPEHNDEFSGYSSTPPISGKQTPDRRVLYASLAACLLLGFVSLILYFNYSKQKESLRELSTIVHDLESREKEQHQGVPAALVQDAPTTVTPDNSTAGFLPDQATPAEDLPDHNISAVKNTSPAEKKEVKKNNEAAITFKETTPVPATVDEATSEIDVADNAEPSTNLFKLVQVKPNDYKTGVLGGISNLQFEITNNSLVELHLVAIEIKYLGPEKKVVKKQTVYFENVSPGAQTTIDVPKSNRGVSIEYTITDIKS